MKDLKEFDIAFVGLKLGKHKFEYQIDDAFFDFFQYDEFQNSNFNVEIEFNKKTTLFELSFKFTGKTTLICDLSSEPFEIDLTGDLDLIVRFGETYDNDNEELLIIPFGEHSLNIAQYIYEMVALSVPIKRVHPGVEDGSLESEVLNKLQEYKEVKERIDPRWEKLKELQTNKKV